MTDIFAEPTTDATKVEAIVAPAATNDPVVQKRLEDKDAYIKQLQDENKTYRDELQKQAAEDRRAAQAAKALEELREEVRKNNNAPRAPEAATAPALTQDQIRDFVQKELSGQREAEIAAANQRTASEAMLKQFGTPDKAKEVLVSRAKELGLSVTDLSNLASRSPAAFIKAMDLETPSPVQSVASQMKSSVNSAAKPLTGQAEKGTREYFDNLLKTNRSAYFSPTVQHEILDAIANGTYKL